MRPVKNEPINIGILPETIANQFLAGCSSRQVKVFPGAIKHIKNRHPEDLDKYFNRIPEIISNPDYVGQNPTEPNSVELIKEFDDDVLVAIKLDPSGYIYLSSMYALNNGQHKVKSRLASGRIIPYKKLLANHTGV